MDRGGWPLPHTSAHHQQPRWALPSSRSAECCCSLGPTPPTLSSCVCSVTYHGMAAQTRLQSVTFLLFYSTPFTRGSRPVALAVPLISNALSTRYTRCPPTLPGDDLNIQCCMACLVAIILPPFRHFFLAPGGEVLYHYSCSSCADEGAGVQICSHCHCKCHLTSISLKQVAE